MPNRSLDPYAMNSFRWACKWAVVTFWRTTDPPAGSVITTSARTFAQCAWMSVNVWKALTPLRSSTFAVLLVKSAIVGNRVLAQVRTQALHWQDRAGSEVVSE